MAVIWYVKQTEWLAKVKSKQQKKLWKGLFLPVVQPTLTDLCRPEIPQQRTPRADDARGRTGVSATVCKSLLEQVRPYRHKQARKLRVCLCLWSGFQRKPRKEMFH